MSRRPWAVAAAAALQHDTDPSKPLRYVQHVRHQMQRGPATEAGAMARARWSDSHRREFQNGLWPVWAVLAVLAWVNVALQLTHSGRRWEILIPVATAVGATALALAGARGKLPVRRRNKR